MAQGSYEKIMEAAALAGILTLQNGGEIYRVEEVMHNISLSYGATQCESYATPTTIVLTIYDEENIPHTVMKRIFTRATNLGKLDDVNQISRAVVQKEVSLDETMERLEAISRQPPRSLPVLLVASALACGTFTILWGGQVQDFICGLFTGAILRLCIHAISKRQLGFFFVNLVGGVVAALSAWLFFAAGFATDWNRLALSTLMLLVPGLLFTNAFRDIVAGDLISGISRAFETLAIAMALACGAAGAIAAITFFTGVVQQW